MPKRKKPEYSVNLIRKLLSSYAELEEGRNPLETGVDTDYAGPSTLRGNSSRTKNMAEVFKADIDRAMRDLSPRQKLVVLYCDIDSRSPFDCAYWLGTTHVDILKWELQAVIRMRTYLGDRQ